MLLLNFQYILVSRRRFYKHQTQARIFAIRNVYVSVPSIILIYNSLFSWIFSLWFTFTSWKKDINVCNHNYRQLDGTMFVKIEGTKMLWYSSQSQFLSWTNCNNFIMLNSTPVVGEDFSVDYLQWLWNNIYIKNISTVYVHLNYGIAYRKKIFLTEILGKIFTHSELWLQIECLLKSFILSLTDSQSIITSCLFSTVKGLELDTPLNGKLY